MEGALADLEAALRGIERERHGRAIGLQQRKVGEERHLHVRDWRRGAVRNDKADALALIDDMARGEPPAVFGDRKGAAEAGRDGADFDQHFRIVDRGRGQEGAGFGRVRQGFGRVGALVHAEQHEHHRQNDDDVEQPVGDESDQISLPGRSPCSDRLGRLR